MTGLYWLADILRETAPTSIFETKRKVLRSDQIIRCNCSIIEKFWPLTIISVASYVFMTSKITYRGITAVSHNCKTCTVENTLYKVEVKTIQTSSDFCTTLELSADARFASTTFCSAALNASIVDYLKWIELNAQSVTEAFTIYSLYFDNVERNIFCCSDSCLMLSRIILLVSYSDHAFMDIWSRKGKRRVLFSFR
jgi:hypothetical protein